MKQIEVQIMGQSYLLGCPEDGEERLRIAVEKVDSAMCTIRDHGKVRARDRIAVLAALNLAFDLTDRHAAEDASAAAQAAAGLSAGLPSSATRAPSATWMAATPPPSAAGVSAPGLPQQRSPSQAFDEREPQLELLLTKLDQALAEPSADPAQRN